MISCTNYVSFWWFELQIGLGAAIQLLHVNSMVQKSHCCNYLSKCKFYFHDHDSCRIQMWVFCFVLFFCFCLFVFACFVCLFFCFHFSTFLFVFELKVEMLCNFYLLAYNCNLPSTTFQEQSTKCQTLVTNFTKKGEEKNKERNKIWLLSLMVLSLQKE